MEHITQRPRQPFLFLDFDEGMEELLEVTQPWKLKLNLFIGIKVRDKFFRKNTNDRLRGNGHE